MANALFPGTFNPFSVGHRDIVERGLKLFDRIVIGIGYNPDKPNGDVALRVAEIRNLFSEESRVDVEAYSGLTADFALSRNCKAILRGVRNIGDFEYERNLADINKEILGIETLFLVADPKLSMVSSSTIRELLANGYDASRFIGSKKNWMDMTKSI